VAKTHQNLQNLKPFAGIGVAYPRHEEAEGEGQHQDVQHEVLLVALVLVRNQCAFPAKADRDRSTCGSYGDDSLARISGSEVPPGA
jgi:hypothetical protein